MYFVVKPPHIPRPKVVRKADALAGVRICRARICGQNFRPQINRKLFCVVYVVFNLHDLHVLHGKNSLRSLRLCASALKLIGDRPCDRPDFRVFRG